MVLKFALTVYNQVLNTLNPPKTVFAYVCISSQGSNIVLFIFVTAVSAYRHNFTVFRTICGFFFNIRGVRSVFVKAKFENVYDSFNNGLCNSDDKTYHSFQQDISYIHLIRVLPVWQIESLLYPNRSIGFPVLVFPFCPSL